MLFNLRDGKSAVSGRWHYEYRTSILLPFLHQLLNGLELALTDPGKRSAG